MIVLGIESSCDETSAAILVDGVVKSNVISSQGIHDRYGGVVPELASRAHIRLIVDVVNEALEKGGIGKDEVNGVAATYGPGLAGALLVGLSYGKALAYGLGIPFVGVNHLEGHLYSNFLTRPHSGFPFLALIVSGGHTMLVQVDKPFSHKVLGRTRDDAAGEAFDKVGKMLGLGYPGGPIIDRHAEKGNPHAIQFPRSYLEEGSFDFSFSGLKTSVLYYLRKTGVSAPEMSKESVDPQLLYDICASFQEAVIDVLVQKTLDAASHFEISEISLAGGVSANSHLRRRLKDEAAKRGCRLHYPPIEYCMDNAAMIGYVGWMKLKDGVGSDLRLNAEASLEL